jgi:hypothetical protein
LLGVAVAGALEELALSGVLPASARTGVILAGDLYSVPGADKRGGHGDVAEVWNAFAGSSKWVAGVAGNHDDVGRLAIAGNVCLLDTDTVSLDGLRIGGVGLIGGNPEKAGRRAESDQLERIELVAGEKVDLLVLHEGPTGEDADSRQPGNDRIHALLVEQAVPLTGDHPLKPILNTGGAALFAPAIVLAVLWFRERRARGAGPATIAAPPSSGA